MRTPETLTAAQRAERLREEAGATTGGGKDATDKTPDMNPKKHPIEKARASLMSGLDLGTESASAGLNPRLDVDGSFSILKIDDLVVYRHNPRVSANPKYAEIKESIVANGITNTLSVTRRPGEDKYFPYGGGNTRLEIAKELHAAGDARFATLKVLIKAWTSESAVLAAHMAENVNRGDTSFWDNAQGVAAFKREWEDEHPGAAVLGAELNQHLRDAGVNYGVKMIQNFMFAVEYLAPVGPWLRALDVNTTLRPSLASFLELAIKLDKLRPAQLRLREALEAHAEDLEATIRRNRDHDERVAVELDAAQLVEEAAEAIAHSLGLSADRMQVLAAALQERPRLSARDLLALDTTQARARSAARKQARAEPPAAPPPPAGRAAGGQADEETGAPSQSGAVAASAQLPLGPMAGIVRGRAAPTSAEVQRPAAPVGRPPAAAAASAQDDLVRILTAIDQAVPIADCIVAVPAMPFGYFVDMPPQPINLMADAEIDADAARMREALWWLLVILSGQTQGPVYAAVRDDAIVASTSWAAALLQGPKVMSDTLNQLLGQAVAVYGGLKTPSGSIAYEVFLASGGLWPLLVHPEVGPLISQLLAVLTRMRGSGGDGGHGFMTGHIELPEWDESMLA